ncbi:unnamed protein product [Peniophora sp. CBMAI 1063]|nr:unnamed protein product [Peniophora sp. CBMAI 1063]
MSFSVFSENLINVCLPGEMIMEIIKIVSEGDPPTPPKRPWNPKTTRYQVEAPTEEDPYLPPTWTLQPSLAPANLLSPGCGHLGGAIVASHVCHRWRELALDHAALWANCIGLLPEQMEEMVPRCKSHPLNVVLYGSAERSDSDIVLEYLIKHKEVARCVQCLTFYQARRGHFREHYHTPETAGLLARCDLSNLRHLKVAASEDDGRQPAFLSPTPLDITWYSTQVTRLSLPALVSAEIFDTSFAFDDVRNLTKLSWRFLEDEGSEGLFDKALHIGLLITCLCELQEMLEELTLESGTYPTDHPDLSDIIQNMANQNDGRFEPLHFRRLRKLTIHERLWQPELVSAGDDRPDEPDALPVPLLYSSQSPMNAFFSLITYPPTCQLALDVVCETVGSCKSMDALLHQLYASGSPFWDAAHVTFDHSSEDLMLLLYQIPENIWCQTPDGETPMAADAWLDAVFGAHASGSSVQPPRPPPVIEIKIHYRSFDPVTVAETVFGDRDLPILAVRSPYREDYTDLLEHWDTDGLALWYTRWEESERPIYSTAESGDDANDEGSGRDEHDREAGEE